MRIIAGQFRSRRLRSLPGLDLRPTSDRLRETLFDVLAAAGNLQDSVWLDLYAGTGRSGHRGAESRRAPGVFRGVGQRNMHGCCAKIWSRWRFPMRLKCTSARSRKRCRCWRAPAWSATTAFSIRPIACAAATSGRSGILSQSRLLQPASLVIAEHEKKFDPGERFGALVRTRRLDQGDASLSFYRLG